MEVDGRKTFLGPRLATEMIKHRTEAALMSSSIEERYEQARFVASTELGHVSPDELAGIIKRLLGIVSSGRSRPHQAEAYRSAEQIIRDSSLTDDDKRARLLLFVDDQVGRTGLDYVLSHLPEPPASEG
jgi:hypothetical protein